VFSEIRTQHDGPVVISQDLTAFDITADAVVARQRILDPMAWPVVGPVPGDRASDVRTPRSTGVVGRRAHHRLTSELHD
jgi:hypothetical protein